MEGLVNPMDQGLSLRRFFKQKSILVTGHTGFKGSWVCEWLLRLGANVTGIALEPKTDPALFVELGLAERIQHHILDIRDYDGLEKLVTATQPDLVFHLAAQPLVRESYTDPLTTYSTNVMGSVHVLNALRSINRTCAAVMITTDKCYENREWLYGYRENDPMGGHDPYSSSKGCMEIAINSFRESFFQHESPVGIASARAGNVIGGGDWAADRIVPDCIRSLARKESIRVRNPRASRPWQHVLEPLSGYLLLGAALYTAMKEKNSARRQELASSFNFGPLIFSNRTVRELVEEIIRHWPGEWRDCSDPNAVHEAQLLNLSIDKAFHLLGWYPSWDFGMTIKATVSWYRHACGVEDPAGLRQLMDKQIDDYMDHAKWFN